ncbi:MAG: adenosine kinase [Spirochaetaceae bacterium]|nr:MAG: adenosine kinase [Spirochaetaceae bacterium]
MERKILGIGNPLVDSIHHVGDGAIRDLGFIPGSMNLIEVDVQAAVMQAGPRARVAAGGSCANTLRGIAYLTTMLGRDAKLVYSGAVGNDDLGNEFGRIMREQGVDARLAGKDSPTGTSTILVSPDGQRTMFTQLGACREFAVEDVPWEDLKSANFLYTTGYMWDTPNQHAAVLQAIDRAGNAGADVSLDIADPFVAERYREGLLDLIGAVGGSNGKGQLAPRRVFCNEDELRSLLGMKDESRDAVFAAAANFQLIWVVKVGAEGSYLIDGKNSSTPVHCPAQNTKVLDTTGAGDSFAAGHIFALMQGLSEAQAMSIVNALAACIVAIQGCVYQDISAEKQAAIIRLFQNAVGGQAAQ